jgi:ubiquinone/menaquinone biosynthesis C-methylase UbiE
VATDVNQAMLDQASAAGTRRVVEWRQADAMRLPFPDGTFDAVVCQFGVMFFPDKVKAFSEVRRVLGPGGAFVFNVWDRIPPIAFCQGTPLRSEIETRDASRLGEETDAAEEAIAKRFGSGAVEAKIQAHVVAVVG